VDDLLRRASATQKDTDWNQSLLPTGARVQSLISYRDSLDMVDYVTANQLQSWDSWIASIFLEASG
jgi:hypothetical protein